LGTPHWTGCEFIQVLADKDAMSGITPEPRTAVMILVEASWENQDGTVQTARARMENKSSGGACIRLKTPIGVGSKLKVQSPWDQFSGVVKYCRMEEGEYIVGIQRDRTSTASRAKTVSVTAPPKETVERNKPPVAAGNMESAAIRPESKRSEPGGKERTSESVPTLPSANSTVPPQPQEAGPEASTRDALREREGETKESPKREGTSQERKHMKRRWFDMGQNEDPQIDIKGSGTANGNGNNMGQPGNRAPKVAPPVEVSALDAEENPADILAELPPMEDIYRAAGIMNPRRGYSVNKVVEMLRSEHMRGLAKEMRRAALLMALDAAGISINEVLQDAKVRQEAIDSYEANQRKQFEALWARKAQENVQIQAELERVKARYMERLRRNLDGVAREKATFASWVAVKQQESQSMAEAVEMCAKPNGAEAGNASLADIATVDAIAKPS
jgi:hypothetical protein